MRDATTTTVNASATALPAWIRTHFGIHFTPEQLPLLDARIDGLCRERKIDVHIMLSRLMTGDRDLTLRLAEVASTNHTFFFRESEVFDFYLNRVLPDLASQDSVRIWSAAASSGDEAYSLAILTRENWGDRANRVKILGTDISQRQVDNAERGIYPRVQLAQLGKSPAGDSRLQRYFTPMGLEQYKLQDAIRGMCSFRRLNLTQTPWPFDKKFHAIFLRNVLYYFEPKVRRQVVESCYDAAEPGAYLITSLTEPMLDLVTRWIPVQPAIYRKALL
ncbi:MAG: CheR family methyltransferase [Myxococcota bacterium]